MTILLFDELRLVLDGSPGALGAERRDHVLVPDGPGRVRRRGEARRVEGVVVFGGARHAAGRAEARALTDLEGNQEKLAVTWGKKLANGLYL